MANEIRIRANGVGGALDAGMNNTTDTTMSSPALADLPAVGSSEHAAITLFIANSDGRITLQEIVWVTAHTASATTATVLRGQEGTSLQTWGVGHKWVHGPTAADTPVMTTGGAPSTGTSYFKGQRAVSTDGHNYVCVTPGSPGTWTGAVVGGAYARIRQTTGTAVNSATWTAIAMDAEDYDTGNLHSTSTNNSRITIAVAGTYLLSGQLVYPYNGNGMREVGIWKNGVGTGTILAQDVRGAYVSGTTIPHICTVSTGPVPLAANDYIELAAYQNSGSQLITTSNQSQWSWLSLMHIG